MILCLTYSDDDDDLGESLSMLEELIRWDLPLGLQRFRRQVIEHCAAPLSSHDASDMIGNVQILGVLAGGVDYVVQSSAAVATVAASRGSKQPPSTSAEQEDKTLDLKHNGDPSIPTLPIHVNQWLQSLKVVHRTRFEERLRYDSLCRTHEIPMSELDQYVLLSSNLLIDILVTCHVFISIEW
jgi:hypothetical protein